MMNKREQKKRTKFYKDFEYYVLEKSPNLAGKINWDSATYFYSAGLPANQAADQYIENLNN